MKLTKRLNHLMKPLAIGVIVLMAPQFTSGQPLTLVQCHQQAEQLSPLKKQEQYIVTLGQLNQQLVQNNWLPTLNLKARASYQSDVFNLPLSLPGTDIPEIPKDQYQVTLNLSQNLYDGGISQASANLEQSKTAVQSAELEASLYQIHQVINELYFGILTLEAREDINQSVIIELDNQLHKAESAVKNGTLLTSGLKSIQKQKLTILQQQNELKLKRITLLKVLGDWIGEEITLETSLEIPKAPENAPEIDRPELNLFTNKINQLKVQQSMVSTQLKPKLIAFATTGYGSPNPYNFFETDWNNFYMVGGQIQWTPWNWNSSKKQHEILTINQQVIQTEQENFIRNINNQITQQQSEIDLLESSLSTDKDLLELQKSITKTASAQFEQGVISATDYLSELNALNQSTLQYELHQIQLIKAKVTLQNIAGKSYSQQEAKK